MTTAELKRLDEQNETLRQAIEIVLADIRRDMYEAATKHQRINP